MTCATCDSTDRTIAIGEDKVVKVTVYESSEENAAEQILDGFRLILVIAAADTTAPLLTKDTDAGVQKAEVVNQTTYPGQCWFYLTHADTADLEAGTYDMEVWLDDGTNTRERVLDTTITVDGAIEVPW